MITLFSMGWVRMVAVDPPLLAASFLPVGLFCVLARTRVFRHWKEAGGRLLR